MLRNNIKRYFRGHKRGCFMQVQSVTDFTTVDQTGDPEFFSRFLHQANRLPSIVAAKSSIIEGLRLRGGERVLDVGCGMGADVFALAAMVGESGHVTGVDFSEALISEAKTRAAERSLAVSFEVADAQSLPFAHASFDAVRTERMLMHVPNATQAIAEMVRVLRPGGRLSVFDMDWETQFCDSSQREVTRKIALSFCDGMKNGWIGRSLPRLFKQHGMFDLSMVYHTVTVDHEFLQLLLGGHVAHAVSIGTITESEANSWWADLDTANRESRFLYGWTAMTVASTRGS